MDATAKKNILSLTFDEAKSFLLKEESYFRLDLPKYFTFGGLLNSLSQEIGGKALSGYYKEKEQVGGSLRPYDFENVNYQLMNNKNGKYAWRLFQLIHPAIYVALVHDITSAQNWGDIQNRLRKNECVECLSLPIVSQGKQTDKAMQVTHWWEEVEQRSIVLALEYEHVFHTDITDCYGSIYTHSISWALHTKSLAKQNKRNKIRLCGDVVDSHLMSMTHGQTNGIPQGSVLMDLIAEIVLSYADELLSYKILDTKMNDFKILRYRDDYRIFVNNPRDGEEILKCLTEVLAGLGMQLNTQKTLCSNNIVRDSVKPDKLYLAANSFPSRNMQKELFAIKHLAELFPNSGSLLKRLERFYQGVRPVKKLMFDPQVLISLVVDLAIHNPRVYPVASAILSKMIDFIPDDKLQKELIVRIKNKFEKIPNTEHMDIWLQRITLKRFRDIHYNSTLCKLVSGERAAKVWNSDWLKSGVENIMSSANIIDVNKIERLDKVIQPREVSLFRQMDY